MQKRSPVDDDALQQPHNVQIHLCAGQRRAICAIVMPAVKQGLATVPRDDRRLSLEREHKMHFIRSQTVPPRYPGSAVTRPTSPPQLMPRLRPTFFLFDG